MDGSDRELAWLRRVRDVCALMARETSLDRLLEVIVDSALELADAERGFLVLVEEEKRLHIRAARGFGLGDLEGPAGAFSRSVVGRVVDGGREVLTRRSEDAALLDATSLRARNVRSVVGVPLRRHARVVGALYLDAMSEDAFVEQDLPILATFADQAVLALDAADGRLEPQAATSAEPARLVASSAPMKDLLRKVRRVAVSREVALILGESGTGKEVVARELHALGPHPAEPFVAVSCAALASELLESELFGHVKGAFSGATASREGVFVSAGRGTILLDEVSDMEPRLQAKLLRVLQERTVRPLGGGAPREVGCRVLASTHEDLRALVGQGAFREDLYYRLDVLRVNVPPLRARAEEIPALVEHLAARRGARLEVSPHALELLRSWHWPGNVRELENEVSRLVAMGVLRVSSRHLSDAIREGQGVSAPPTAARSGATLPDIERSLVEAALRATNGNKARAARQLGIPRTSLYHLIARYGLG